MLLLGLIVFLGHSSARAQIVEMPWYLGSPNSPDTASAINVGKLIQAESTTIVVVAVLDNGVDSNHPSLAGKLLPGVDMISPKSNPKGKRSGDFSPDRASDLCPINQQNNDGDLYHGTKVSSVIAGNGSLGITGVLRSVKILPVKVVGACKGKRDDLIDGIAWAAGLPVDGLPINPNPAKVINISMAGGASSCNPSLQSVIDRVVAKNIIVVSAAGNTFGRPSLEPSVCNGVISIGAVNPDKSNTFYSAFDARIIMGSPGGGPEIRRLKFKNKIRVAVLEPDLLINSATPAGADIGIGTSFAAPLASGAIAGLALENPTITFAQVMDRISRLSRQADGSGLPLLNYESLHK